MANIPLNQITDPDNRKYSEDIISATAKGIEDVGQLHNVHLHKVAHCKYHLIAGGKRFQAMQFLKRDTIGAVIYDGEMSDIKKREISLIENLERDNKSWYDIIKLRAQLHDLRVEQHGPKVNGVRNDRGGDKGWSGADTANELKISRGLLSEDLMIANAIKANPNLTKVKDRKTAMQLIKGVTKREEAQAEAQMPCEFEMNQIFLGDSLDILHNISNDIFDVCITDPPWLDYKDENLKRDDSTMKVFDEIYKKLRPNSFLYVIVGFSEYSTYFDYLTKLGFTVQKHPLIWRKPKTITHGRRLWEYARDYEPIIVAAKGSPSLTTGIEMSAILEHDNLHHTKMIHPHEKPVSLLIDILQQCSYPGSRILDPFGGSGVLAEACVSTNRHYVVIERDADRHEKIIKRMEGLK